MITESAATLRQRRAALELHALSPADQAWLLERLGPDHQAQVLPLLAELQALGIPADAEVLSPVFAQNRTPENSRRTQSPWYSLSADTAFALLEPQPSLVIAYGLKGLNSATAEDVLQRLLERLTPPSGAEVRVMLAAWPDAPALNAALDRALQSLLAQHAAWLGVER